MHRLAEDSPDPSSPGAIQRKLKSWWTLPKGAESEAMGLMADPWSKANVSRMRWSGHVV